MSKIDNCEKNSPLLCIEAPFTESSRSGLLSKYIEGCRMASKFLGIEGEVIRLISARKATGSERRTYEEGI
jgi:uncharacterized DUF497 family protein